MPYRTCVFCNRNDSKPGREDVLAKWIFREFPESRWEITNHETGKVFTTRGNLGLISKRPCLRCNNGWMSKLEVAVKPVLVPLMNGSASVLTPAQQLLVVRWFIKTVTAYQFLNDRPCYFEQRERHALMKSLTVPANTMFFLAHYNGPLEIETRETPVPLLFFGPPGAERPTPIEGYAATFLIKQLALQVFSVRRPKKFHIAMNLPGGWNEATVQIWPIGGDVTWPPRFVFDDAGFDLFSNRWTTLQPPL
jgi:hypothetical protein